MKRALLLGLFCFFGVSASAASTPQAPPGYEVHMLRVPKEGLFIRPFLSGGFGLLTEQTPQGLEGDGVAGLGGGLTLEYYFSNHVGLYVSGSAFNGERMGTDEIARWGVGSGGFSFQFHWFNSDITSTLGVGVSAVVPLSNYAAAGSPVNMRTIWVPELRGASYLSVGEGFEIGITSEAQLPIQVLWGDHSGQQFVGLQGGISARVHL